MGGTGVARSKCCSLWRENVCDNRPTLPKAGVGAVGSLGQSQINKSGLAQRAKCSTQVYSLANGC